MYFQIDWTAALLTQVFFPLIMLTIALVALFSLLCAIKLLREHDKSRERVKLPRNKNEI